MSQPSSCLTILEFTSSPSIRGDVDGILKEYGTHARERYLLMYLISHFMVSKINLRGSLKGLAWQSMLDLYLNSSVHYLNRMTFILTTV